MVNVYRPHVLVLPEDQANSDLVNGFQLELPPTKLRQLQVLDNAGGWRVVVDLFCAREADRMRRSPERFMVLLLDLDDELERLGEVKSRIPEDLVKRVFILSVRTEPEDLPRELGQSLEACGSRMAKECDSKEGIWSHPLLAHNSQELERIRAAGLHDILF